MRGVFKRPVRVTAAVLLLVSLTAPAAFASSADEPGQFFSRWKRAKQTVITIFSRFGGPPG
jgi:hypothetical protein